MKIGQVAQAAAVERALARRERDIEAVQGFVKKNRARDDPASCAHRSAGGARRPRRAVCAARRP